MYDDKNEAKEFIADDRSSAIEKAVEFFGVEEAALAIHEYEAGEAYGMAGRSVLVAVLRDRKPPVREARDRDDRGGRGDRGDRGGRGRSRNDRGDRGDRGGRGGRGRGGRDDRGNRAESRERSERPERPEPPQPTEPSVGTASGELGEIGEFLCGVVEKMDLGPFEISEKEEDGLVVVQVRGSAAPRMAGDDGRAVDALQLLANQAAGQLSDDPVRVVIDVEGNSDAREDRLAGLAEKVAQRARESGRSVRLDAMNGRDRRIIHLALRDEADIATMSTGEGRYRQVVIVPEGAPEYEAARQESEAASRASDD